MKSIKKILIVCTGNSCRSIMAEGYLVKRLKELRIKLDVISAGTGAVPGLNATVETVQVMKENGIDVSGYISTPLDKMHVDTADVILVMSPLHKESALNLSPDAENKIFYLKNFSPHKDKKDNPFIEDPIGKPVERYRDTFKIIRDSVEGFLEWIQK